MTEPNFGTRWADLRARRGALCVGIDAHPALLADWGLADDAGGLRAFALACAEAAAGRVGLIKLQSAFFERHGSAGIAALEATIGRCRELGALVLLDAKRGDIGSTMAGYADAYLRAGAALEVDAITLSPYLGYESLRPALDLALEHNKGAFVLALTSNPEARELQSSAGPDGRTVAQAILDALRGDNADAARGALGAVIGASVDASGVDLDIGGPLLAPGYGAQGGTLADLRRVFAGVEHAVIPTTSRAVASHGPDPGALAAAVDAAGAEVASL